jgi:hypothetical protein
MPERKVVKHQRQKYHFQPQGQFDRKITIGSTVSEALWRKVRYLAFQHHKPINETLELILSKHFKEVGI